MGTFLEVVIEGLKKFSAEIIAALLFAFCMWKFPKLRSFLSMYKRNREKTKQSQDEKEEILKKLEEIQSQLDEVQRQRATQEVQEDLEEQLQEVQEVLEEKQQQTVDDDIGGYFVFVALSLPWIMWYFWGSIITVLFTIIVMALLVYDDFDKRHPKLFNFFAVFAESLVLGIATWLLCWFIVYILPHIFDLIVYILPHILLFIANCLSYIFDLIFGAE